MSATGGSIWLSTRSTGASTSSLTLSDFDPVMAHGMHRTSWTHLRTWLGARELTREGAGTFDVSVYGHPAQGGTLPRATFAFRTRQSLRKALEDLPADHGARRREIAASPRLAPLLTGPAETPRMRAAAWPRLFPVTLHHKMAVFDEATTYIGGLDVNARRIDTPDHEQPAQDTWHDLQLIVRNAAVAQDARQFLTLLRPVTRGETTLPAPTSAFRATLSRARQAPLVALRPRRHATGLFDAHLDGISSARALIYLESQYFRDPRIARALADAGRAHADLRCIVMIPAAPEDVAFDDDPGLDVRFGENLQVRAIRTVRRAFGPRFFAASPAQPRLPDARDDASERARLLGAPIIYVHSKVSIFDGHRAIVSSANLNGRSLSWDAEAGVILSDADVVNRLRSRIVSHWMNAEAPTTGRAIFDAWHTRAMDNAALEPGERHGFLLPYDLQNASALAQPIPGAPQEMV